MKNTVMTIATVTVVGLTGTFFANTAHAEKSVSQIQNERSAIKANLSDADSKIADVLIELEELNTKISRVESALADNKKQMGETEENIKKTKDEVKKLEDEIAVLQEQIDKRQAILQERIISYQKTGGDIGFLDVIFGSQSFGDLINRISAVSKITNSDTELIKKQEEDKAKLSEKQDSIQGKLDKLTDMKAEIKAVQETMLEQKEQNDADKQRLNDKKEKFKKMKSDLKAKDSKLAALQSSIHDSIATVSNTSNTASNTASKTKAYAVPPSPSGNISAAINAGYKYIGNSVYVFGAGRSAYDVQHGRFDCSGFVSWSLAQAGISAPASTSGLSNTGTQVSYSNIQPGDLVFFDTYKTNGHVGIYIGGGKFIGSQTSTGVGIASMNNVYWSKHFKGHVRRVK